jgi:hypothetical protein
MTSPDFPFSLQSHPEPEWVQKLNSGVQGLCLARENGFLLAWDGSGWLYLFNPTGQRQSQRQIPGSLANACGADDGSAYAAAGASGEVWWLAPDLSTRWQRTLSHPILTLALDPFGQYLAVSDQRGQISFFNRLGQQVGQTESVRPFHHLAFVPAAPLLVGCADYALVGAFDLNGQWRWRDGLVAHVGALAVTGDGAQVLLACFSEGIQRYDLAGNRLERLDLSEPLRLVSTSFDGRVILAAGLTKNLFLVDKTGGNLSRKETERSVSRLALAALGDFAIIGLVDGQLIRLRLC